LLYLEKITCILFTANKLRNKVQQSKFSCAVFVPF